MSSIWRRRPPSGSARCSTTSGTCTVRGAGGGWSPAQSTFYDQADFKSRDVVLTFHVGLALRMSYLRERDIPVAPEQADLLPGSWRRWQQAFDAYDSGDEAETFQAVGVRLRECLVSFIGEAAYDELVPAEAQRPKNADFKGWTDLLANCLAGGESAARLRSYLKKLAVETWEYVNWLTHAKNATRVDAEIGLKAVEHMLGVFTAARVRPGRTSMPLPVGLRRRGRHQCMINLDIGKATARTAGRCAATPERIGPDVHDGEDPRSCRGWRLPCSWRRRTC